MTYPLMNEKTSTNLKLDHYKKTFGTPALLLSKNQLAKNYESLTKALPGVDLYYAVKANFNRDIVSMLHEFGCKFDVSTNAECDLIDELSIPVENTIHTHPIKSEDEISHSLKLGINEFTVDNPWELKKLIPYKDQVKVNIRIAVLNKDSRINLSSKFGTTPKGAIELMDMAFAEGIHIQGFSFHTGSQNSNPAKYLDGIDMCLELIEYAKTKGHEISQIDIGGGFPSPYIEEVQDIYDFCQPIREHIKDRCEGIRIIAEPGRYLVGTAMSLITEVKGISYREGTYWYFLNDGIYQSFSGKVFDHCNYSFSTDKTDGETFPSYFSGPTCDSCDIIRKDLEIPMLEIGDVVQFHTMGAYCSASASHFNGYAPTPVHLID